MAVGDVVGPVEFALPIYRLVVAAGGNRDFNSIHHNRSYAVATNAPDAYASTFLLMGTWERVVRDWIGDAVDDPGNPRLPYAQFQPGRLGDDGGRAR